MSKGARSRSLSTLLMSRFFPLWPLWPLWLLLLAGESRAHELELGGFVGGHFYLNNDELGRPDGDFRSPGSAPQHTGMFGLGIGYGPHPNVMFEGELALVPGTTRDSRLTLLTLNYRAHLVVHILRGRFRPFLLLGGGAHSSVYSSDETRLAKDTDPFVHGGLGLKVNLTERLMLRVDGRVLFPPSIDDKPFTENFEALVGLYGHFDLKRKRPVLPLSKDSDRDGVEDSQDKCPTDPEDLDRFQDEDGCPEPDNDQDQVLDADDKCPNAPGPAASNGCPPKPDKRQSKNPDLDGDGVLNEVDKCPDKAGVKQLDGCPDTDGDGIADAQDKCPDKAETKNGFEDEDGCPDAMPQAMERFTGVIQGINFKTGKDVIAKSSFKLLDQAVAVLKEYPSIHMEISGHTDNAGKPEKNKDLSQRRAESVKRYFVEKGIAQDRLIGKGYGDEKPIADNKKKAGKKKNRRVEFKVLSQW